MLTKNQPSPLVTWTLAMLLPILAGVAVWLVIDATVPPHLCDGEPWSVYLLVFAAPAIVAWRVRRATSGWSMFPVAITIFLSFLVFSIEPWWWWSSHGCMT